MKSTAPHVSHAKITVVDDHPLLRDGLKQLICREDDLDCTGAADNTADAKRLGAQLKPDLVVLDLRLKSGDAIDLIKTLRVERPDVKVLVLSQYDELIFAERVLRVGASGYVMNENATERFCTPCGRSSLVVGSVPRGHRLPLVFADLME